MDAVRTMIAENTENVDNVNNVKWIPLETCLEVLDRCGYTECI